MNPNLDRLTASGEAVALPRDINNTCLQEASCCHHA